MREKEQGGIIKCGDTRNQEGREGKKYVHKKGKAHLFSVFISTLLSEVLRLSQFSKAKMNSYWILSPSTWIQFETDLVSGFFQSLFVILWGWSRQIKTATWLRLWSAFASAVVRGKITLEKNWCGGEDKLRIWHFSLYVTSSFRNAVNYSELCVSE